jgi:hypothetical protein
MHTVDHAWISPSIPPSWEAHHLDIKDAILAFLYMSLVICHCRGRHPTALPLMTTTVAEKDSLTSIAFPTHFGVFADDDTREKCGISKLDMHQTANDDINGPQRRLSPRSNVSTTVHHEDPQYPRQT